MTNNYIKCLYWTPKPAKTVRKIKINSNNNNNNNNNDEAAIDLESNINDDNDGQNSEVNRNDELDGLLDMLSEESQESSVHYDNAVDKSPTPVSTQQHIEGSPESIDISDQEHQQLVFTNTYAVNGNNAPRERIFISNIRQKITQSNNEYIKQEQRKRHILYYAELLINNGCISKIDDPNDDDSIIIMKKYNKEKSILNEYGKYILVYYNKFNKEYICKCPVYTMRYNCCEHTIIAETTSNYQNDLTSVVETTDGGHKVIFIENILKGKRLMSFLVKDNTLYEFVYLNSEDTVICDRHKYKCIHVNIIRKHLQLNDEKDDNNLPEMKDEVNNIDNYEDYLKSLKIVSYKKIPLCIDWLTLKELNNLTNEHQSYYSTKYNFKRKLFTDNDSKCLECLSDLEIQSESIGIVYDIDTAHYIKYADKCCKNCKKIYNYDGKDQLLLHYKNGKFFTHKLLIHRIHSIYINGTSWLGYTKLIRITYINTHSPVIFCDRRTFQKCFDGFIGLLEIIKTNDDLTCPFCDLNNTGEVQEIAYDGVSVILNLRYCKTVVSVKDHVCLLCIYTYNIIYIIIYIIYIYI